MLDTSLMDIVIKLNKDYAVNTDAELKIDKNDINEELMKQPSKIAWFSVLYALAIEKRDGIKNDLEFVEAELDKAVRSNPTSYGIDKMTEGSIAAASHSDELWIKTKTDLIAANRDVNILSGVVNAFDHRKDMLVTLCANMRQEREKELFFKAREKGVINGK